MRAPEDAVPDARGEPRNDTTGAPLPSAARPAAVPRDQLGPGLAPCDPSNLDAAAILDGEAQAHRGEARPALSVTAGGRLEPAGAGPREQGGVLATGHAARSDLTGTAGAIGQIHPASRV